MPKHSQTSQQTTESGEDRRGTASAVPNSPFCQEASAAEVSPVYPRATATPPSSPTPHSPLLTLHSPLPKRLAQITLLLLTTLTMLGAGTPSTRFDKLGHKLMCPCGCAEILLECNHVGCPDSDRIIAELHTQLGPGNPGGGAPISTSSPSDTSVLNWFAAKYGATVLAAPMRGGFDLVAWIMPFAVLALGIGAAIWLGRHWRDRHTQAAALATLGGNPLPPPSSDLRDRIRQDTTY